MQEINQEEIKSTEFDIDLVIINTRKRITELVGYSDELKHEQGKLKVLLDMQKHYYEFKTCYVRLKELHKREMTKKPVIRDNVLNLTIKEVTNGGNN